MAQGFQKALSPHLTKKLLKPENIDLRDGLLVKRVDNPDDYEGFLNVFQKSFGMKDETIRKIRQWQHMDGFTEDSCHKNFVAFKDDQIVGCASHYIRDGYCGFYNVGVLDSHRRQGIGRRVTQFALNDAFHRGARECGCYSSDMALNVYKGIGLTPGDDLLGFYK